MSVFHRLTKEQILEDFDNYGFMHGIVPIYVGDPGGENRVAVRNWCPEFVMDVMGFIHEIAAMALQTINPEFQPFYTIKVGKKIT